MNITKALIICTVALFQTVTLSIAAVQTTVATMSNPQENSSVPTSTTNYITEQPCFDKLKNCGDYGNDSCLGIFHIWALDNCQRHCGLCNTTKGCHDNEPTICSSICTDATYKAYVEVNCRKTCYLCPDYSSVPTSTTNYITEPPCFDKLNNCGDYGNDVCLGIFHSWALENCKRRCGMCYTTVQKGCHDKEPTICTSKRDVICTDAAYKAYAEVYCQKTCNLCPGHTTQTPKYCTFHGTKYPHGYQWTNGCDKKCTCDNGRFNCIDLCQRIISVFRLKCCHPEFIIRYLFPGVCSYDGKTYKQDERWFDGCKFGCVCKDAMLGQYKCYNLCPKLELPEICHWNAAKAGKCCRRPECPSPLDIFYYPDF